MSEKWALIYLVARMLLLVLIVNVALSLVDASGVVYGLAAGLIVALGGWLSGGVVMRYAEIERRKEREELILSR